MKLRTGIHSEKEQETGTRASCLMALEPRIMFDGAAVVTAVEVADAVDAAHADPLDGSGADSAGQDTDFLELVKDYTPPVAASRNEIVFVDSGVENYEQLVQNVSPEARIVVLDSETDGLSQITSALSGYSNLDAIHILSHGESAEIRLGSATLNLDNLQDNAGQLSQWQAALGNDADIMLYGCDVAAGEEGAAFVAQFAQLTGADVAASSDITGSADFGGDWDLEHQAGGIETGLWGDVSQYHGIMATVPTVTAGGTLNYTENDAASVVDSTITVTEDGGTIVGAQVIISVNYVDYQDELLFTDTGSITGTWDPSTGTLTLTGTDTVANYQAALRSVKYINHSDEPLVASRTVTFTADDGVDGVSSPVVSTITIAPVNDAPFLDASGSPALAAIDQGTVSQAYSMYDLYSMFGYMIDDPDFHDTTGVAITGADNANGTWQYSTDGGATWSDIGPVSDTSALVLQGFPELEGKVSNSTDLAAGNLLINGTDVGAVSLTTTLVNGLNMQGAYNLANAINAVSATTGVVAELDTLYAGGSAADLISNPVSETISFDVNGIHISVTVAPYASSFEVAQAVADAIKINASSADIHAWVGNGTNGGAADSVIIESDGNITIANLAESTAGISGLANGTYSVDGSHNRGDVILLPTGGSFTVTTSAGDDSILNLIGMDGGVAKTYIVGDAPSDGFINVNFPLNKFRFVPNADFSGTATLTFRAWDQTDGLPNATAGVNVTSNGGTTPYSSAFETISITVNPVVTATTVPPPSTSAETVVTVGATESLLTTETTAESAVETISDSLADYTEFAETGDFLEVASEEVVEDQVAEEISEETDEGEEEGAEESEEDAEEEEAAEEEVAPEAVAAAEGEEVPVEAKAAAEAEAAPKKGLSEQLAREKKVSEAERAEILKIFNEVFDLLQCK